MIGKAVLALGGAAVGGAGAIAFAFHTLNKVSAVEIAAKTEAYKAMNGHAQRGQTVFAGDSITEGYRVAEWFAGYTAETGQQVLNRGINAETSAQLLARWADTVLALEPSRIVLLIGTNDLAKGAEPEAVAANVKAMLAAAKQAVPDCRVIVQAVYPINPGAVGGIIRLAMVGKKSPAKIARLNALLADAAKEAGATFLDLTPALAGPDGLLDARLAIDGLHPNAAGYAVITPLVAAALTA
jgi:lysophospholipase L1-like esterase